MGELMRQYWIPALLSTELAPDGTPLPLKLLGERLIAFRDSSGRGGHYGSKIAIDCPPLSVDGPRWPQAGRVVFDSNRKKAISNATSVGPPQPT